jgi:hypothetical protein
MRGDANEISDRLERASDRTEQAFPKLFHGYYRAVQRLNALFAQISSFEAR